jgi:hypothetical protein
MQGGEARVRMVERRRPRGSRWLASRDRQLRQQNLRVSQIASHNCARMQVVRARTLVSPLQRSFAIRSSRDRSTPRSALFREGPLPIIPRAAGVVQWQNGSFPSFIRGFDSLRPLQGTLQQHPPIAPSARTAARTSRTAASWRHRAIRWSGPHVAARGTSATGVGMTCDDASLASVGPVASALVTHSANSW